MVLPAAGSEGPGYEIGAEEQLSSGHAQKAQEEASCRGAGHTPGCVRDLRTVRAEPSAWFAHQCPVKSRPRSAFIPATEAVRRTGAARRASWQVDSLASVNEDQTLDCCADAAGKPVISATAELVRYVRNPRDPVLGQQVARAPVLQDRRA